MLLVGRQEGHLACKKLSSTSPLFHVYTQSLAKTRWLTRWLYTSSTAYMLATRTTRDWLVHSISCASVRPLYPIGVVSHMWRLKSVVKPTSAAATTDYAAIRWHPPRPTQRGNHYCPYSQHCTNTQGDSDNFFVPYLCQLFRHHDVGQALIAFWPTVLSVEPMVQCVVCLSLTFCIVAKRCVLAKNCLKEWIGNQGQKFFRSPPYFYFRFRRYGHWDGRFCLIFCLYSQAVGNRWSKWTF